MPKLHYFVTASCVILSLTVAAAADAATCHVESGPDRVALVELYSSEGCSSCPPADRWLSRLATQTSYANRVVPLEMHVDYWDYIGWHDEFANPAFSARQREQAGLGWGNTTYTPEVMLNGHEFRNWSNPTKLENALKQINSSKPLASISLAINQPTQDRIEVTASARTAEGKNADMYLALYENDIDSQVTAGENRGSRLHHDHVVRAWLGPYSVGNVPPKPWQQSITLKNHWKQKDLGMVAFVQDRANGEVLQVLSTESCDLGLQ